MFDLHGRVAVVTGASSGIGVQFAEILAKQGANVAVLARRKDRLDALVKKLEANGGKALAVKCDVTDIASIKEAANTVIEKFGKVDILVNNAGGASPSSVPEKTSDEDWDHVIELDLNSCFRVAREFGKNMILNKYGRIINIASMYGLVGGQIGSLSYHTAKGGVINMTRALAAEWATHNITVNSIGPGFFESELTEEAFSNAEFQQYVTLKCPMGRTGNPGELDSALIFLAADESTYVTGQTIYVDGGWTAV